MLERERELERERVREEEIVSRKSINYKRERYTLFGRYREMRKKQRIDKDKKVLLRGRDRDRE